MPMPPNWSSLLDASRASSSASDALAALDDRTTSSSGDHSARSARARSSGSLRARLLKRPRVPSLSPSALFNRLQIAGVTVVDCRSAADFAAGHVRGALLCEHGRRSRHKSVDDVLASHAPGGALHDKLARRDMMEIVVVGSDRALLQRMDGGYRLAKLLLREGRVYSVYFLADGFAAFAQKYPFLVERGEPVSSSISTDADASVVEVDDDDEPAPCALESKTPPALQYPNEIIPEFLYLGNFWQANNAQIIADLGITHVVNMGAITHDRNKFEHVTYLDVEIKDKESVDIRKEFAHTVAFIQEAARDKPRSRVLIHCVQGVSRSSTIVIWYLMLETKCTLSAAYSYVFQRRPLIFPNRGFMEQLMENEKELYGVESVLPQELDLLQHGLLPPLDRKGSALRCSLSS